MSAVTKRKYVAQEFLEELMLPDEKSGQQIVQIIGPRGNNLHEVKSSTGESFLVSMPPKFRKSIWIKRGDFVLIDPIAEGDKVKGEIVHIIRTKDQIAYIKTEGKWPAEFEKAIQMEASRRTASELEVHNLDDSSDSDEDSEDNFSNLAPNLNRINGPQHSSYSATDSEDSSPDQSHAKDVI